MPEANAGAWLASPAAVLPWVGSEYSLPTSFHEASMTRASLFVTSTLGSFAAGAALLFTPAAAFAQDGIAACGNIDVSAEAKCKVEVSGGCKAKCEPIAFRAACSVDARAECTGGIDVDCNVDCKAEVQASCEANPGNLDCDASCTGGCEGSCDADCSGEAAGGSAKADCTARCKASCSARCDASCTGTPPSASCEAKAEASCKGRCEAKSNLACDVKAQAECEAELKGGCEVQCDKPEGALYCDGSYVDAGNNLEQCINALEAFLTSKVDVSARGSAECSGNECEAEGEASASCSTSGPGGGFGSMALLGGGLGLAALVRRRARKSV